MDDPCRVIDRYNKAHRIVDEQANDDGLWFMARTAPEAYLQQELRRLHEAIEGKSSTECGMETLQRLGQEFDNG